MMREAMSSSGEKMSYFGQDSCILGERCCLLERTVECGGQNVLGFAGSKAAFCGRKCHSLGGKAVFPGS